MSAIPAADSRQQQRTATTSKHDSRGELYRPGVPTGRSPRSRRPQMPTAATTPHTDRLPGEPRGDATGDQQARRRPEQAGPQRLEPKQIRDERDDRADPEHHERRAGRDPRRGLLARIDAQLLHQMEVQRAVLVAVDLFGGLDGGVAASCPCPSASSTSSCLLGLRMLWEGPPLDADLGVDLLVGGGDRRVLAQRHRERARQQSGDTAEHDGVRLAAAATPAMRAVLLTRPSIAPKVAARSQPPVTSPCR